MAYLTSGRPQVPVLIVTIIANIIVEDLKNERVGECVGVCGVCATANKGVTADKYIITPE